ncbi:hypothetical protein DCS_06674 [Drechmeria coniospora]|uniref:Uncharacterized protein n=1 Tax=Drechmeria coniospora TaxID=98403 RepID=A0A151GCD0_DRECN|nr:hypothetical protein DCS_06674 [Drechmeria coniospora]KYK54714.1 hypothetical protein DCS_06674 [Drechmeria coniospora]
MAPSPADMENWWLTVGIDALSRLVDRRRLAHKPCECGYLQAIHRKLRAFDNDPELEKSARAHMATICRASNTPPPITGFNPRRTMNEVIRSIFRHLDHGAIEFSRALLGLEHLDRVELHRLHLLAFTRAAMYDGGAGSRVRVAHDPRLIEELHRQASFRYRQFYMGFRACILVDTLSPRRQVRTPAQAMARLNALFPPFAISEAFGDGHLIPCSNGLRDSLRFSIYEHLMGDAPLSDARQRAVSIKVFAWCDIPGYPQA